MNYCRLPFRGDYPLRKGEVDEVCKGFGDEGGSKAKKPRREAIWSSGSRFEGVKFVEDLQFRDGFGVMQRSKFKGWGKRLGSWEIVE